MGEAIKKGELDRDPGSKSGPWLEPDASAVELPFPDAPPAPPPLDDSPPVVVVRPIEQPKAHVASPRCPYCHEDVNRGEPLRVCDRCHAFHHGPCWRELGGCAACGEKSGPGRIHRVSRAEVLERDARARQKAAWGRAVGVAAGLFVLIGIFIIITIAGRTPRDPGRLRPPAPANALENTARAFTEPAQGVVTRFLDASIAPPSEMRRAKLEASLTPDAFALFDLESFQLEDSLRSSALAGARPSITRPDTAVDYANRFATIGLRQLRVVRVEGEWRVERLLDDRLTEVAAHHVRLLLPAGLAESLAQPSPSRFVWEKGGLSVEIKPARVGTPPDPKLAEPLARGGRAWFHRYDDPVEFKSFAFAEVELMNGLGATLEVSISVSKKDRSAELERILRRSLDTLELVPVSPPSIPTVDSRPPDASSPASWGPLVARELPEGFTIQAPAEGSPERLSVTFSTERTLEGAIAAASEKDARFLAEARVPGALLPWRGVYEAPDGTLVVKATGIVDGRACILRATAPATRDAPGAVLRLEAMAASLVRFPAERLWPGPDQHKRHALPGSKATIAPPVGWTVNVVDPNGHERWLGRNGDAIDLVVKKSSGHPPTMQSEIPLDDDFGVGLVLMVTSEAFSDERQRAVAEVAQTCLRTLEK